MTQGLIKRIEKCAVLNTKHDGWRCDRAAADLFTEFSRTRLRAWIESGALRVDGKSCMPRDLLSAGARLLLRVEIEPAVDDERAWVANALELNIVHEDETLLVVDKSAGMVVHPAPGHRNDTMVNALLFRYPELSSVPRAGIVHRLDKDTSGLLVVARHVSAYHDLVAAMQRNEIQRHYHAIAEGVLESGGRVDHPIGRDTHHRTRMAVVKNGRQARTRYRIVRQYRAHTYIALRLETGRTHQIRVHMAHLGHPLVGDRLYGASSRWANAAPSVSVAVRSFKRQALHASSLGLTHPHKRDYQRWQSPLPEDMRALRNSLEEDVSEEDIST